MASSIYLLLVKGIERSTLSITITLLGIGIILLFFSAGTVLTTLAKKSEGIYYKGLHSFLVKQVSSNLKVNMWVMVALTGLLILSITILGVGFSVTASMNGRVLDKKNIDFTIMMLKGDKSPRQLMKENEINPEPYIVKEEVLPIYASPISYMDFMGIKEDDLSEMDKIVLERNFLVVAESDYNALRLLIGEELIDLQEDEFLINANYKTALPYYEKVLEAGKELELFGKHLKSAKKAADTMDVMVGLDKNNPGILVVSDALVEGQLVESTIWNAKTVSSEAEEELFMIVNNKLLDRSVSDEIYYASKVVADNAYIGMFGVIAFICSYLGLILTIVTLAVLALQQLAQIQENKERYLTLTKIGASKKMVQRTINGQIGVYFGAPLLPALLLSTFVVKAVLIKIEPFFGMKIGMNLAVSVLTLLVIYLIYYIVTCRMSQNIIIEKRVNQ